MTERKTNWTLRECEELVDGFVRHHSVLSGKHGPTITEAIKNGIYQDILLSVNSVGGNERTGDEMNRKWKDLKSRTKKKEQSRLKAIGRSGLGGLAKNLNLTTLEEKVLSVIPDVCVVGIPAGADTSISFSKVLGTLDHSDSEKEEDADKENSSAVSTSSIVTSKNESIGNTASTSSSSNTSNIDKSSWKGKRKRDSYECQCSSELLALQTQLLKESRTRNSLLMDISVSLKTLATNKEGEELKNLVTSFDMFNNYAPHRESI